MTPARAASDDRDESAPLLLDEPSEGIPEVVTDRLALESACADLAAGSGPVAVDTERASGYRYWPSAYLVQLRRAGSGTILLDPVPLREQLAELGEVLNGTEWVLHAASQDLPCLEELGLRPATLFDTELAGRLAGFERVALGTIVERLLGYRLEKGHSAADWSRRPLPASWLNYAALDVELLLPLKEKLETELAGHGKLNWAHQEFAAVRDAPAPSPRAEPWRRTSGIHRVKTPRGLAALRALWQARDKLAREHDRAPGRVLPDKAIVEAVLADPRTTPELHSLSGFGGRRQRRYTSLWLRELQNARVLPQHELPDPAPPGNGPPPTNRWSEQAPEAAARLAASREALNAVAEQRSLPVENLLQPDLLRRLCWQPPRDRTASGAAAALREAGARPWQVELVAVELGRTLQQDGHTQPEV